LSQLPPDSPSSYARRFRRAKPSEAVRIVEEIKRYDAYRKTKWRYILICSSIIPQDGSHDRRLTLVLLSVLRLEK
jgi:hypothetical protein